MEFSGAACASPVHREHPHSGGCHPPPWTPSSLRPHTHHLHLEAQIAVPYLQQQQHVALQHWSCQRGTGGCPSPGAPGHRGTHCWGVLAAPALQLHLVVRPYLQCQREAPVLHLEVWVLDLAPCHLLSPWRWDVVGTCRRSRSGPCGALPRDASSCAVAAITSRCSSRCHSCSSAHSSTEKHTVTSSSVTGTCRHRWWQCRGGGRVPPAAPALGTGMVQEWGYGVQGQLAPRRGQCRARPRGGCNCTTGHHMWPRSIQGCRGKKGCASGVGAVASLGYSRAGGTL